MEIFLLSLFRILVLWKYFTFLDFRFMHIYHSHFCVVLNEAPLHALMCFFWIHIWRSFKFQFPFYFARLAKSPYESKLRDVLQMELKIQFFYSHDFFPCTISLKFQKRHFFFLVSTFPA